VIRQHLTATPRPVTDLRASVPAACVGAIQRVLAKAPADRYATTGEFAAALVAAAPVAPRRGSSRAALLASVAAALALATWLAWGPVSSWLHRRNAPAQPAKKEWVLVAEFEGPTDEPDLARAAQSMTAAALDQSGIVMTVPADQLGRALVQAGRPDTLRVDGALGRELAYRNGIRSVLEGRVSRVGAGYNIALRLSDSGNDSTLVTVDASARDRDALIPALDGLTRRLRKKLGENPEAIRSTRGVDVILTPSFEAYRLIERGADYANETGDAVGGMRFLRSVLELDPDCAYAYLDMATDYQSQGRPDSAVWACDQALKRPHRLTDEQRLSGEAKRAFVRADYVGARQLLNRELQIYPNGQFVGLAYNLLSTLDLFERRFDDAVADGKRCVEASTPFGADNLSLFGRALAERAAGRLDDAGRTTEQLRGDQRLVMSVDLAVSHGDWAKAESLCMFPPQDVANGPGLASIRTTLRVMNDARRGQVRAAQEGIASAGVVDPSNAALTPRTALFLSIVSGTTVPGLDSAVARDTSIAGFVTRGWRAALVGDSRSAREALSSIRKKNLDDLARAGAAPVFLEASIAAGERRWSDVIRLIGPTAWRGDDGGFNNWKRIGIVPERWLLADAYDHTGPPDSAAVAFERVLEPPYSLGIVEYFVPYAHQRLVMIYARMGRLNDAERHWEEFSATFTNPDPEVKHLLDDTRDVIQELRGISHPKLKKG